MGGGGSVAEGVRWGGGWGWWGGGQGGFFGGGSGGQWEGQVGGGWGQGGCKRN